MTIKTKSSPQLFAFDARKFRKALDSDIAVVEGLKCSGPYQTTTHSGPRAPTANRLLKSRSPSSRSLKLSGGGQLTRGLSAGPICSRLISHGPDLIRSRK